MIKRTLTIVLLLAAVALGFSVSRATADSPAPPPQPVWMSRPCATAQDLECYWVPADHGLQGYPYWRHEINGDVCTLYSAARYATHHDSCRRYWRIPTAPWFGGQR